MKQPLGILVIRRVGGLEAVMHPVYMHLSVIRRVGGLEVLRRQGTLWMLVIRRVGGLEGAFWCR